MRQVFVRHAHLSMVIFSLALTPAVQWFVELKSTAEGGDLSTRGPWTPARDDRTAWTGQSAASDRRLGNSKQKLDSRVSHGRAGPSSSAASEMTSHVTCREGRRWLVVDATPLKLLRRYGLNDQQHRWLCRVAGVGGGRWVDKVLCCTKLTVVIISAMSCWHHFRNC